MVRMYYKAMFVILLLYLAHPILEYFIYWEDIPTIRWAQLLAVISLPFIFMHFVLILTGRISLYREKLMVFLLLFWISIIQIVWLPILLEKLDKSLVIGTMGFTLAFPWILLITIDGFTYILRHDLRIFKLCIIILFASLAFIIIFAVFRGFMKYGYIIMAIWNPKKGPEVYNHLLLGDTVALLGLVILGILKKPTTKVAFYLLTILLLFLNYSRLSFYLFFLTATMMILSRKYSQKVGIVVGIIIVIAVILYITLISPPLLLENPSIRMRSLFSNDPSMAGRISLMQDNLELLKSHWLLGHFLIDTIEFGKGSYAHNWLSFWIAYGAGPFVLSIYLMVIILLKTRKRMYKYTENYIAYYLLLYAILAIILGRSYIWPYIWLTLGFASNGLYIPSNPRSVDVNAQSRYKPTTISL